jgi:hypothetical protein
MKMIEGLLYEEPLIYRVRLFLCEPGEWGRS